jgi:cytoskeletal protein CcmA (bactofilin family)
MALKDFMGRTQGTETPRQEPQWQTIATTPPVPSPSTGPSSNHTTYLGATIVLAGELRCAEPLRIDGTVKGDVYCEQMLTIGEKGCVHASIDGDSVVIAGEVQGDIKARRKITLESTARVTGDLTTPGIVIQEGARLEGRIMIGGAPPAAKTAEKAPEKAAEKAPEKRAASPGEAPARAPVIASGA